MSDYNYKEEAEKIKKARGFYSKCFYTSNVTKFEKELSFYLDLDKFQKVINKCLDEVEEGKIKYNITEDLNLVYIDALEFRIKKFKRDPEPYFATNEDYESWLYD